MEYAIHAYPVDDHELPAGFTCCHRWTDGTLHLAYRRSLSPLEIVSLIAHELAAVQGGSSLHS